MWSAPTLPGSHSRHRRHEENCWKQKTESQGAELGLTVLPVTAPGRAPVPADAIQPRRAGRTGLLARVPPLTRARAGVLFFFLIVFKTDFMRSQNETMIVN